MYDEIVSLSREFIAARVRAYKRYFIQTVPFDHRFGIILGERGVGKTTTLIQYLLEHCGEDTASNKILYVQVDHIIVGNTRLYDIAQEFTQLGGEFIAFDEIHKYENWSIELKSIYDTFSNLRILVSGSSALEIYKGSHDLSRRALIYKMLGLSFREYIELKYSLQLPYFSLKNLLADHEKIEISIINELEKKDLKILALFKLYCRNGYYPFCFEQENIAEYWLILEQNIHATIESDLVSMHASLSGNSVRKIKKLVSYIAKSVPFIPEWKKIKSIIDVSDDRTLKNYFKFLEDSGVIHRLIKNSERLVGLETEEKVYLSNPNQLYALNFDNINVGTVRETFFISMLKHSHDLSMPSSGDVWVDNEFLFEIGGKNKDNKQIRTEKKSYRALDDIEKGIGNKIPLWLFGFLY